MRCLSVRHPNSKSMLALFARLISAIGSIASAVSLLVTAIGSNTAVRVALFGVILFAFGVIVVDVRNYFSNRPKTFPRGSPKINSYMKALLRSGGRAAIFSRDLSWAGGADVQAVLEDKARKSELLIFAGRRTDQLSHLARLGAEVYDYSGLGFIPQSRFTFIDYEKFGTRLAVGLVEGREHVIREFATHNQDIMAISKDLVELARRCGTKLP
jgi:hypothetical protein